MKKKVVNPENEIDKKFLGELHKLMPRQFGQQLLIFNLVKKYYNPNIAESAEIKQKRLILMEKVHQYYTQKQQNVTPDLTADDILTMVIGLVVTPFEQKKESSKLA